MSSLPKRHESGPIKSQPPSTNSDKSRAGIQRSTKLEAPRSFAAPLDRWNNGMEEWWGREGAVPEDGKTGIVKDPSSKIQEAPDFKFQGEVVAAAIALVGNHPIEGTASKLVNFAFAAIPGNENYYAGKL